MYFYQKKLKFTSYTRGASVSFSVTTSCDSYSILPSY